MKSTKPRRITKACDQCSRFRRKCDGHLPCLLCREKGRTCTYTKPVRKRGPESSKPYDGSKTISTVKTSLEVDKMPFFNPSTLPVLLPKSTLPPLVNQIPISVETTVINSIAFENPVSRWSRKDFLVTRIVDVCGNVSTILDMYFGYPYQHIPIFSKLWIQQNLKDVPMYVLHAMYILVLTNPKFAVPNGRLTARPHLAYVRNEINNLIEDCDPFTIAAMINVALYYFYLKDETPQIAYISLAMKESQLLGLNRDVNLNWRSTASGRMLGHEIGMDKNFLRSMWFLLYQWDHHNVLVYHNPLMIDSLISDSAVNSYVPPNVGDSSNIPLK